MDVNIVVRPLSQAPALQFFLTSIAAMLILVYFLGMALLYSQTHPSARASH